MKLADKLFELRKEKGWSQEKLAERQCYCGCVFGAQDQGIDLVKVKKEAAAFMTGKDLEKDYSHIKFTVID